MGQPDVGVIAALVTPVPPGAGRAVEVVGDPAAVRRDARQVFPLPVVPGEADRLAAGDAHLVQVADPRGARIIDDPLAVGREAAGEVVGAVEREPARLAALRRHQEQVIVTVPIGGEDDPAAVRAVARLNISRRVHRDPGGAAALGGNGPEIAEIGEAEGAAVRRDGRIAGALDRLRRPGAGQRQEEREGPIILRNEPGRKRRWRVVRGYW